MPQRVRERALRAYNEGEVWVKENDIALLGEPAAAGHRAEGEPAIAVQALVKIYGAMRAVDELTLEVVRGEIFALLGPNGAGKTTTVEILEGYRAPDAGGVRVLGLDPGAMHAGSSCAAA